MCTGHAGAGEEQKEQRLLNEAKAKLEAAEKAVAAAKAAAKENPGDEQQEVHLKEQKELLKELQKKELLKANKEYWEK